MKGHRKLLGEEGVLKVKNLEAKYEAKLEFPGRRGKGCITKNICGGSMDIFWNCTIKFSCLCKIMCCDFVSATTPYPCIHFSPFMQIMDRRRRKETQMFFAFPQYLTHSCPSHRQGLYGSWKTWKVMES